MKYLLINSLTLSAIAITVFSTMRSSSSNHPVDSQGANKFSINNELQLLDPSFTTHTHTNNCNGTNIGNNDFGGYEDCVPKVGTKTKAIKEFFYYSQVGHYNFDDASQGCM